MKTDIQRQPKRTTLQRILYAREKLGPYAEPHRAWLTIGLLGTIGVVLCRLLLPWPLRGIMDLLFPQGDSPSPVLALIPDWANPITWLAASFMLIALGQGGAELVQRFAFARFSIRMVHDARASAVASILDGTEDARSAREPGDLIARVIGDTARIKAGLKGVLIHVAQNGLYVFGAGLIMAVVDLQLGLIFLAGLGVVALVSWVGSVRIEKLARQHRRKEGDYATRVHRALEAAEASNGFQKTNSSSARADTEITRLEGYTTWTIHGVLAASTCFILAIGSQRALAGDLSTGALFTFMAYLLMVHDPTVRLGRQATRLGRVLASAERLAGVFDGRGKPRKPPLKLLPLAEQLEVREALLQERINVVIRRGERVAVIGPAGSGKTALLELLAGLRTPHKGEVAWDGVDLQAVRPERRQKEVGFLPQAPSWPRQKLRQVVQLPAVGEWPESLRPLVEHTGLSKLLAEIEGGLEARLSSYELSLKQRKALALLGFVQAPVSVWLLDEPMSELSARRASAVLADVLALAGDRTVVVTMSESTQLEAFDRVIALRRGAIRYDGPASGWLERRSRQIA